ncbi:MAG: hypothetical protein ACFE9N_01315 [Promethearchaeota archaeon]
MAKEILKGLKWTFLVNFIVFVVFGALLFFLVEDYMAWFSIPFLAPIGYGGLFGGALLGYGSASFIAWQQTEWEKVKIVVIMQIVWHMVGVYTFFWWTIFYWPNIFILLHAKIMNLIYLIVFSGFLAAFIFFYIKHEKKQTT